MQGCLPHAGLAPLQLAAVPGQLPACRAAPAAPRPALPAPPACAPAPAGPRLRLLGPRQNPAWCPGGWGRHRGTALWARHPKSGLPAQAGQLQAPTDPAGRNESRRVLPSPAATPRNEKSGSFQAGKGKKKRQQGQKKPFLNRAASAVASTGTSPLTAAQPPAATQC